MLWNAAIYAGCYESIKSFSESWLRRASDFTTIGTKTLSYSHRYSSHGSIPSFTPLSPTLPAASCHEFQQGNFVRERSKSNTAFQNRRPAEVEQSISPAHKLLFSLKMDQLSDSFKDDLRLDGTVTQGVATTSAEEKGKLITDKIHALAEQTKKALLNTPFVLEGGGNPSTFAEAVAEAKRNAETLWPGYRQAYFSSRETCRVILSPDFDGECLGADLKKLLCESLINFSLRIWNETVVKAFQKAEESYIVLSNDAFRTCSTLLGGETDPYEAIKLKQLLWQSQESAERVVFGLFERIYARMASVNMRQNCEASIRNICKQVIRTSLLPLFTPNMTLVQYHSILQSSFSTIPGKCASAIILLFTNTISHAVFSQLDTLAREIEQLVRAFVSVLSRTDTNIRSPSPQSPQEDYDGNDNDITGENITVRLRDFYHTRNSVKARTILSALENRRNPTETEREDFKRILRFDGIEVARDAIAHMAEESLFGSLGHAVYGTEEAGPIVKLLSSLELIANPHEFAPIFPGGFEALQRYAAQKLFSIKRDESEGWSMETENVDQFGFIDSGDADMSGSDCLVSLLGFSACTNAAIALYSPYIAKPVIVEPANMSKQNSIAGAMRRAMKGIANGDSSLSLAVNTIFIAFIGGSHNEYRPIETALLDNEDADDSCNPDPSAISSKILNDGNRVKKHCDCPVLPPQPVSTQHKSTNTPATKLPPKNIGSVKSLSDLCIESIARRISQFPAETPQDLPEDLAGKVLTQVIADKRCDGVDFDIILMRLLQGGVSALDLADCSSYITRQSLITVGRACPGLTKLSLANCPDLTSETAAVIIASCHELEDLNFRKCTRICDNLLQLIATNCPHLRSIDISYCSRITPRGLECLWRCTELESLTAAGCSELTDAAFSGFSRLSTFDAFNCGRLTDATLRSLAMRSSETLRVLRASSKLFTDEAAAGLIATASSLEVVDFSGSSQVGLKALHAALEHRGMNVQKLSFAGCATITDAAFPQMSSPSLAKGLSPFQWTSVDLFTPTANMSSLNLSGTQITDVAVRWISEFCPQLVALNVSGCSEVTDAGLGTVIAKLPLALLNASKCPKLTDAPFCNLAKRASAHLRQVAFSSNPEITDNTMNALALHCPNLRELDCSYCHRISDESFTRVVTSCRSIEVLIVDDCPLVTDRSFAALSAAPSRSTLKILKASFLPGLTGAGTRSLFACGALEYLDVSYCQNVSALDVGGLLLRESAIRTLECRGLAVPGPQQQVQLRGMALNAEACAGTQLKNVNFSWARAPFVNDFFVLLAKACYRLESVNLSRCDALTDETVKQIAGRCPRLKYINLAGCPMVQGATIKFLVLSGIMVSS